MGFNSKCIPFVVLSLSLTLLLLGIRNYEVRCVFPCAYGKLIRVLGNVG